MSVHEYDAVVIGGGVSGLTAAIHLSEKGFKTAVISKGDPVCCLSTGCVDVLTGKGNPLDRITGLPSIHPYSIAGTDTVRDALAFFLEIINKAGLSYTGSPDVNRNILTPIGTVKNTCLVPCTMAAADMQDQGYLHVVSFKGLKDFYPNFITNRIRNSAFSVFDAGVSTTLGIATRFEEKAFLDGFIAWLQGMEIPHDLIGMPAVLGLSNPAAVMEKISAAVGRQVFEIPTLPPSIPGMRLFRALKGALLERGGHLYWGKGVTSVECQGDQIEAVTLATTGRSARVQGRAFILATGSFVSGGLFAARESLQENVFHLPVHVPAERKDWFNTDFFVPGHAIERAGIEINNDFRPRGSRVKNLFVCGSILAHSEIMKNQCGHGLALTTGVAAARMCSKELS